MQIGELAKRTGLAVSQIRYYERRRILPPPVRSGSGYRVYGEADVARLRLLRRTKLLGLSLAQIGELLETAGNGCCNETEPAGRNALEHRLAEVGRQIAELEALRGTLAAALGRGAPRPTSDEACGSEFCLMSEGHEVSVLVPRGNGSTLAGGVLGQALGRPARTPKLPERELPLLAVGECCLPDCGPQTCG